VLLDADGVVQENPEGWLENVKSFVDPAHGRDFVDDLFATEAAAMTGDRAFEDVVAEVGDRWGVGDTGQLLEHWRRIEVSAPVVAVVGDLRRAGVPCYLATNQNSFRAAYMQQALGYDEHFDGAFYSCELGVLKSSPDFFAKVLAELSLAAGEVLFVDDSDQYVDVARSVGLQAYTWSTDRGVDVLRHLMRDLGLLP
jgi:putative hydrolase of the HAD superfamily